MEKQHANKCRGGICERGEHAPMRCKCLCECDGYHTFTELYDHRITLYIALCKHLSTKKSMPMHDDTCDIYQYNIWRSKYHSDGGLAYGGTWFVLGIGSVSGNQITYHLPIERWDETGFAKTLEKAPEWDGHTSDDVIERLKTL